MTAEIQDTEPVELVYLLTFLRILCQSYYSTSWGTSCTNEVLMKVLYLISSMLGIIVRVVISFLT